MNTQIKINPFDILICWIVAVSFSSVMLLCLHQFKALNAMTLGTVASIGIVAICYKGCLDIAIPKGFWWLVIILVIAFVFRAKPYLWVMGGQDQGLYVNISEHYEKHGSPFVIDKVRSDLSEQAKGVYDKSQHYLDSYEGHGNYPKVDIESMKKQGIFNLNVKHNNPYAMHTSAVFMKDMSKSQYVFQFYPLHSLWMSIFSKVLGSDNRVYSQVFFGVLSLVSFFLLARELSGRDFVAGLLAAALLACNPLHAFFSKFPVTEMPTLFFSATGFYYLARYYNQSHQSIYRKDFLLLSGCLFACLFFTRITGFLYMPLFYFLLLTVLFGERASRRRRHLAWYAVGVTVSYLLSAGYGLIYSYPYFMLTHDGLFSWVMGKNWLAVTAVLVLFAVLTAGLGYRLRDNVLLHRCLNVNTVKTGLAFIVYAAALVSLARITLRLCGPDTLSQIFSYNLIAAIAYISPVSFYYLFRSARTLSCDKAPFHLLLLAFWAIFFALNMLSLVLPYQYYFTRYLLSEVVPYAMLLVALYWSALLAKGGVTKRRVKFAVGLTCAYFLLFSSFQLQGTEADGAAQALQKVKDNINKTDLLLLGFDDLRLQTSFSYYYDLNTYRVDKPQAVNEIIFPELKGNFNRIFLVAKSPLSDQALKLVAEIPYREGAYEHANHIPMNFEYVNQYTLYLYEIDKTQDAESVYNALSHNKIWSGPS